MTLVDRHAVRAEAITPPDGPPDPRRVSTAGPCRMRACAAPTDRYGFCGPHLLRFVQEPLWVPLHVSETDDGSTINRCGCCGGRVWTHRRADTDRYAVFDRDAHRAGTWHLVHGRAEPVVVPHIRDWLTGAGIPLYRLHAPVCGRRPKPLDVVL